MAVAQFDGAVGVPDRQVAGVEPAVAESLGSGVGLFKIAVHDIVAVHYHLAHRLAVLRHVLRFFVDHPHEIGGPVGLALARQQSGLFGEWFLLPLALPGAYSDGAIGFGEAVEVDGVEVIIAQLPQQGR